MIKNYKKYKELVIRLAKMDFKLRYHGSFLGYIWAILKPLLLFAILNFVFSSIFNFKNSGNPYYPLELLTALLMFNFFVEGTSAGLLSLISKSQLVTKIYVPRWTIVLASTINSFFVFLANLFVLVVFFFIYSKMPSLEGIIFFILYIICLYILILAFSFLTAPLFVRFRDLSMIWEVLTSMLMYAAPIVYPLSLLPQHLQRVVLFNPLSFIIHFAKQGLISNHFATPLQFIVMVSCCILILCISFLIFRKTEKKVAENI
jgi:ABC-2 type transport system permease protein